MEQISVPLAPFVLPILVKENTEEVCEAEPETLISTSEICEAEPEEEVAPEVVADEVSEHHELVPAVELLTGDATLVDVAAAAEAVTEKDLEHEEHVVEAAPIATPALVEVEVPEAVATASHEAAETTKPVSPDEEPVRDASEVSPADPPSAQADEEPPKEDLPAESDGVHVKEEVSAATPETDEAAAAEVVVNGHVEEVVPVEKHAQTPLPEIVTEPPFTNGFTEANLSPIEGIVLLSASDDEVCLADPQVDEGEPLVAEVPSSTPEIISSNGHTITESTAEVLLAETASEEVVAAAEEVAVDAVPPEHVEVAKEEVVEEVKEEVAAPEVRTRVEFVRVLCACNRACRLTRRVDCFSADRGGRARRGICRFQRGRSCDRRLARS